jgi:hypothetical protein
MVKPFLNNAVDVMVEVVSWRNGAAAFFNADMPYNPNGFYIIPSVIFIAAGSKDKKE